MLNTNLYSYNMKPRTILVTIIYRVQYKLHNSTYSRVMKPPNKKGETIYFLTDTSKANINIPTTMPYDKIDFSKSWLLEKALEPQVQTSYISRITQYASGQVKISFDRSKFCSKSPRIIDIGESSKDEYSLKGK